MAKNSRQIKLYKGAWGLTTVLLLRFVVGGVFVFSGFVKAIDPWGSVYKFGEYLTAFGLSDFDGLLLMMAVAVATAEFMLGVFTVVGAYRRFAPVAMLLMMAAMLPLTLYLAVSDIVGNCGCFGDAVVMSNWAAFWKNVALTLGICYLVRYNKKVKNLYGFAVQWIVGFLSLAYALLIAFAGYYYQPLIDFRPYTVGSVLKQNAGDKDAESRDEGENYVFVYEKGGERRDFSIDSLPDASWTFVDRHIKPDVLAGNHSESDDLHIAILDKDFQPADSVILTEGEQLLFLFPDMKDVGVSYTYLINEMYDYAQSHGISVIGITSASEAELDEWNDLSMASYELYHADDSQIKMLARGNPAVVYLKDGKIEWKRTLQSMSMDVISADEDMDSLASDFDARKWLGGLTCTYIAAMLLLLIINRTHLLWKIRQKRRVKKENKA